ncbi:MAG: SpaH/EbpB family LPXTG-anchored major pilin [Ruminococcus sp.]|nr:SpaH/EbpB family LPXTG-anchored major pilin [Ruminococcus sp.]
MKTTKKIFAALLAVMMLLVMVPFSASAAEQTVTINLSCPEKGYIFTVYQVATLDKTAGKYTAVTTDTNVMDAINGPQSAQVILGLLKDSSNPGTVAGTYDTDASSTASLTGLAQGIYYVVATTYPESIKSSQSSLVVLPEYKNNEWVNYSVDINLGEKYSSSTASSDKNILENDVEVKNSTTGYGEKVTFRLDATVMGSKEKPLKAYAIVDNMSDALTFDAISSVYLKNGSEKIVLNADKYNKVETVNGEKYSFAIELAPSVLAAESVFYDCSEVVVEYTAFINDKAVVNTAIPNYSKLVYKNSEDKWSGTEFKEVNVYTAGIKINKVDAKTGEAITTSPATFGIYKTAECLEADCLAKAVTTNGVGTFMDVNNTDDEYKFASGTYYVKELVAPVGYMISEEVITVKIETLYNETAGFVVSTTGSTTVEENGETKQLVTSNGGYAIATISNSPSKLPQTGGMGTMMFTIGGAALIACAGILLFVLKRKAQ